MSALAQNVTPSQVGSPSRISLRMAKAARLMAEEDLTQGQIAKRIGITQYALSRWKRHYPAFVQLVETYRIRLREDVLDRGIARKDVRLKKLAGMHARIERVIEKRAEYAELDPDWMNVAGAETGLLTLDRVCIGGGQHGEFVNKFSVDHDLIKRHNEILEQVAKEKGEFEPDKSPKGDQHQHVHIHYPTLTDGENAAAVQAMQADMPPAARRLLTRPSDGKPLDR